ncbi:hypothetical protein SESBI_24750 [Sesbania bispinosa]|nr:hypothetical protein SESBI_24750 [Sesbania bispinosa]
MSSTTTTTSTSPNASESLSEPNKDLNNMHHGGFISAPSHQHVAASSYMPMFSTSSPSPSIQTTVLNTMIDRLPMPDSGGGYFNGTTGQCFSVLQSGVDYNNNGSYLENGVFGSVNIGVEGDMFVPPLENVTTNLRVESTCKKELTNNSNYFDDINTILNNCNIGNNNRAENRGGVVVEDLFQQQLTNMGEWDFEDLMKDVSSFPFLDFSF